LEERGFSLIHIFFILLLQISFSTGLSSQENFIWRRVTGGAIRGRPAVNSEGTIFVISEDKFLYAISPEGDKKWRTRLDGRAWDSLSIAPDGTIYTCLKSGALMAINKKGKKIWKMELRGTPVGDPVIDRYGSIYISFRNGDLFSISHTGRLKWKMNFPAGISSAPSVDSNYTLYLPTGDNRLYAIATWGRKKWSILLAGKPSSPIVDGQGMIYVGTGIGSIVAVNSNGSIKWNYFFGSKVFAPVLTRKRIIITTEKGLIASFTRKGKKLWEKYAGLKLSGSCSIARTGKIYVYSSGGSIIILPRRGSNITKIFVGGAADIDEKSPVLTMDGRIYSGGKDWVLYCIDAEPLLVSPWPSFGCNPFHRGSPDTGALLDVEEEFKKNLDFIYLKALIESDNLEDKKIALDDIESRIKTGNCGESIPYLGYLLRYLVSEGVLRPLFRDKIIINNYPEIRAKAELLLGEIGNIQTTSFLLQMVKYDYDQYAAGAAVRAVGLLKSDPDGEAVRTISYILRRKNFFRINDKMAIEILLALKEIAVYHGYMPHKSGLESIFDIYNGNFSKKTKKIALDVYRDIFE